MGPLPANSHIDLKFTATRYFMKYNIIRMCVCLINDNCKVSVM